MKQAGEESSSSMKITERMMTEELKNFNEVCTNCEVMKRALSDIEEDETFLGEARARCASCNKIFKFDALYKSQMNLAQRQRKKNTGKKPTAYKRYSKAVINLKRDGKSIRDIAKIIDISPTTVQKILQQYKTENSID